MTWPAVFAVFLVCHAVGDFLLQTDWQAITKCRGLGDARGRSALIAHVSTYTLTFVPALIWISEDRGLGRAIAVGVVLYIPHLLIDDGRIVRGWLHAVKHVADPPAPMLVMTVDQSMHLVCLFGAALLAAR
jgi:Protein of unknown function (DUF3307)